MKIKELICSTIGCLSIIAGLLGGLWVGLYWMFYGGIVQIINGIQSNWEAIGIATGICKIIFSEMGFAIPFLLGIIIGMLFMEFAYD